MDIRLRRIGNSLGVILPRSVLESWELEEGDCLELTEYGLRPAPPRGLLQAQRDELRREIALAVVREFTPRQIRAQILAAIHRWRLQSASVPEMEAWTAIAQREDDGELYEALLSREQEPVRLRRCEPYAGLLASRTMRALREAAGFPPNG